MLSSAPIDLSEAISPQWLSMVLSTPDAPAKVDSVRVVETLKTMATKVRFEARLDGGDQVRNLCVKGFFEPPPLAPGMVVNSQAEARFYQEVAGRIDVRTPPCIYAAIDEQTGHGIVLMEDVVALGGRFLSALEPYSPDQARRSLTQLAHLHAAYRGRPKDQFPWMVSRLERMAASPMIPLPLLQELLDGERGRTLPTEIKNAERIHRALQVLAESNARQPQYLVHGDAHAGNLFEIDGTVALIDWQLLQHGHWAMDVAYHLAAALSVEDREQAEQDLLRFYLEQLRSLGVEAPSWEAAWMEYRRQLLYGYFLWGITRRVDPPIIHEFVRRLGSAVAAHGSFELLGV